MYDELILCHKNNYDCASYKILRMFVGYNMMDILIILLLFISNEQNH